MCVYRISAMLFLLLLVGVVVCDLYFDSHILLGLFITLILIIIQCVYVRECYEYSLTANTSLF